MKLNLIYVDASTRFLTKLRGIENPERKRRIIGKEFIKVFMDEARKIGRFDFLAQGTLYPDVIESTSFRGPSAKIKSHHNVGGLPERMHLKLIEPLKELFKDEVRQVGKEIGLPQELIERNRFRAPAVNGRFLWTVAASQYGLAMGGNCFTGTATG
jgi:GMP synthase (glutamine-hydrolysing)